MCVFNMCGFTPCVLRHSDKQIERLSEGLTATQDPAFTPASALASTGLWLQECLGVLCRQHYQATREPPSI